MQDAVLTLNCGSSSIKFAVFEKVVPLRRIAHGWIEEIGTAPHFQAFDARGTPVAEKRWQGGTQEGFFPWLLHWVDAHLGGKRLVAAGHRIVHGGDQFVTSRLLTDAVLDELKALERLAPLHQPHNLAAVESVSQLRPELPQFGCFDTAFHHTLEPTVRRFGIPYELEQRGVRRYGFHGLSYEFVAGRLKELAPEHAHGRILIAHLGNGASLCALHGGVSVDTSMGFSTLDGLVMGTRCGAIDPGGIFYLLRQGLDPSALENTLYTRSGLLGVSGISSDMRVLLTSADPRAKEAIDLFVFRVAREAAALAMTMGGLDSLVFTAGIGENSAEIRRRVCQRLSWMGLSLDADANAQGLVAIHAPSSVIKAWVIPTDEETVIAQHVFSLLA
ncbi:MAG TPA: acetate/propionate family kinase [Rhizomicrobium sp.]|nr:acetate/propionate family kinase [Rhizomicrobium sp.]